MPYRMTPDLMLDVEELKFIIIVNLFSSVHWLKLFAAMWLLCTYQIF